MILGNDQKACHMESTPAAARLAKKDSQDTLATFDKLPDNNLPSAVLLQPANPPKMVLRQEGDSTSGRQPQWSSTTPEEQETPSEVKSLQGREHKDQMAVQDCSPEHMEAEQDIDITNDLEQELILKDGRDQFCMWHLFQCPKRAKASQASTHTCRYSPVTPEVSQTFVPVVLNPNLLLWVCRGRDSA
ncbi:hypothetical protein MMC30_007926 [Trapelia coarctata]|nr:hypothetical protein [Trapelia coarctata]